MSPSTHSAGTHINTQTLNIMGFFEYEVGFVFRRHYDATLVYSFNLVTNALNRLAYQEV